MTRDGVNDAVVLELLADRPHQNRAQHNLRRVYITVPRRSGGAKMHQKAGEDG